ANTFETFFSVTDPTADRTVTFQDNSGVVPLGTAANTLFFTTTAATNVTLPTTGTLLTNTASANQTLTSTQTSGTVLNLTDATNITATTTGAAITLSGTGAFDQTGLAFALSGATGSNLNDILGSGSTWKVSTLGLATFAKVNGLTISGSTGTLTIANGSSFITSGAFSTTLTSTAATTLTLPTTGTLATLAGAETLTNKTLTAPFIDQVNGTGPLKILGFVNVGSAVNNLYVSNNSSVTPFIAAEGTGTDVNVGVFGKGAGVVLTSNLTVAGANGNLLNKIVMAATATGSNPSVTVTGDANRGLNLVLAGTGALAVGTDTANADKIAVLPAASAGVTAFTGTITSADLLTANRTWTFPDANIAVNAAADISGTTLASNVVTSSLTTVGALASGSIASGFGTISTANSITTSNNISTTGTGTVTSAGLLTASSGLTVTAPGAVNLGRAVVTQLTSNTTGVTINAASGVITPFGTYTTAARTADAGYTVTNSAVAATSVVIARVTDYSGTYGSAGIPDVIVDTVAAGSFHIRVTNVDGTNALNGTIKIAFTVL
ncbi:MAG: hypothetical protein AAB692_03590, partial [Patescibacteria group bacterium]